jgi:CRISPR-associated protein Csd2
MSSPSDPKTRHDFAYLFDVTNGNPNGDPDNANMPRIDPETMLGLVSDVALKRKVRDFVATTQNGAAGKSIFIQSQTALNSLIEGAGTKVGAAKTKGGKSNPDVKAQLCKDYFDIRLFGAVLSTGDMNAGQVRGPIQLTFARSFDPVLPLDLTVTRVAITKVEDKARKETEMGRKPMIPYGLYLAKGHYNPFLGEQTGVTKDDLDLFWDALGKMFEFDRSASRGEMACRGCFVFTHESRLGSAPSHKLFDLISVQKKGGNASPRSFNDYTVSVKDPATVGFKGINLTRLFE